tara:strand:- start:2331 stop:3185 length:855 start_codon:yes stop_codon:yes gene_type:complete
MRNNEDRLGTKKKNTSSPAEAQSTSSGGLAPLDFVRPTTLLELPSKGLFYPEGHPLHGRDTIQIRQMTTAEEDILSNRALLQKGVAIDKFLERILIDENVKPVDLLVGDKNAVLIQARIDGYGSEYTTQVACPACATRQKNTFDLVESSVVTGTEEVEDVVRSAAGNFIVTLDNGWEVEIRPLTGVDEAKILKSMNNKKKAGLAETQIQDQLNAMIVSISGHEDRGTIAKAVQHMTGKQSRLVRDTYRKVIPNLELKSHFDCRECGASTVMEVPLNAEFFWTSS